jgi:hypothetical protein
MENHKENQKENNKDVKVDLIDAVTQDNETTRSEKNIEKSKSSNPTSNFEKKHARTNHALGGSHEPGTTPGTGF